MLRPIPIALASCTRFFEAMFAMRETFATLQNLQVGNSSSLLPSTPTKDLSQGVGNLSQGLMILQYAILLYQNSMMGMTGVSGSASLNTSE
uniref:Uncharacterized protein n=1 Tax=Nelumbo nucifera TaxID=4432 RepID=A0A822ZQ10_NELNU|nr:TPA_asm: hypothetical protein HUJ06_017259 [Nelumbo nucifera]